MKKKILAFILGIALAIQPCMAVNAAENNAGTEATQDTEKPVIHRDTLTIDKTEATVGDVIKFSVKVTDNTALKRVFLDFENLDNNNSISYKDMTYNPETDKYEYSLSISDTMVAGNWRIDAVGAYDVSGNYDYAFPDHGVGGVWDFHIKNDNVDSQAPIIDAQSLKINKKVFTVGDEIIITAKITDNVKVDNVDITICKDSEIFGDRYNMIYNEVTGLYECKIKTDDTWIGSRYVRSIFAYDAMKNYSYKYWEDVDPSAFFKVSKAGVPEYDCEVVELKCTSGETAEYSYSYGKGDNVVMRIFDPSIVGYSDQSYTVTNIGYERGGVFTPYKEGKTTVEVYSTRTGKVLKAYKIEVSAKQISACTDMAIKGTFNSNVKQNYSVLCDNQVIDATVRMIKGSEIGFGSTVYGQYEYEYNFSLKEKGTKKISIIGEKDQKELVLYVTVNSHKYSEPTFTWNTDGTCVVKSTCATCGHDQILSCNITSETKEPTCLEKGTVTYTGTCLYEGKEYKDTFTADIEALGHKYLAPQFVWANDFSCMVHGKCERCNAVVSEQCEVKSQIKDPTCTEKGERVYTAVYTLDGQEYTDTKTEELPTIQHNNSGIWETIKDATCAEEGKSVQKCTMCGAILEEMVLTKTEHSMGNWMLVKPSTETEEGLEERYCMMCNYRETKLLPMLQGPVIPGWHNDSKGWKYQNSDGSYATSQWKYISGKYYYFGDDCYMYEGGWHWINGNCYYMYASGAMASNTWIDGSYVDESGAWVQGRWMSNPNGWWYRNPDGSYPRNEWKYINGAYYYFGFDGYMYGEGWHWINGKCYYMYASGAMASNTWIDGSYVDGSGAWVQGRWISDRYGWWYRNPDGSYPRNEWRNIDGSNYYFGADGYMYGQGWHWINGKCYYMYANGAMASNAWIDGSYVDENGVWVQ